MNEMEEGLQVLIEQGMTYIKKLRRYNAKNKQYQDHINQVAATIKLLENGIKDSDSLTAAQQEMIESQGGMIKLYEELFERLKRNYPEVWNALQGIQPPAES